MIFFQVFYSGKGSVLGIKQSWPRTGRWSELIIPKASKIIQIAVGHEGSHAILVTEDGSTYFTGTARRGEDGDQSEILHIINHLSVDFKHSILWNVKDEIFSCCLKIRFILKCPIFFILSFSNRALQEGKSLKYIGTKFFCLKSHHFAQTYL